MEDSSSQCRKRIKIVMKTRGWWQEVSGELLAGIVESYLEQGDEQRGMWIWLGSNSLLLCRTLDWRSTTLLGM